MSDAMELETAAENIFPSIETIQEIKVSSINNGAEYAQVGDITTITKGGTNQFHGTAFWNYNGNGLNANPNYFTRTLPARSTNNDWGGSVGGPVFRDKTFFFGAFERLTLYGNSIGTALVPEAPYRQGDFSSLTTAITDPSTGNPFAGNIIPAARINSVSKIILDKYIPAPNIRSNQNSYSIASSTISNQFDARLDHVFGSRHNVFGRYSYKNWDRLSPTAFQASGPRVEGRPTRTTGDLRQLCHPSQPNQRSAVRFHDRRYSADHWVERRRLHRGHRPQVDSSESARRHGLDVRGDFRVHALWRTPGRTSYHAEL